jgi:hypothetical protein
MNENYDLISLVIGEAGKLGAEDLREAIQKVIMLIEHIPPTTAVDITLAGYNEDPREIFQIPEARRFILGFAMGLVEAGVPLQRLLPSSVDLIRLCLAAAKGQRVEVRDDPDHDITQEVREHQERAKRSMH